MAPPVRCAAPPTLAEPIGGSVASLRSAGGSTGASAHPDRWPRRGVVRDVVACPLRGLESRGAAGMADAPAARPSDAAAERTRASLAFVCEALWRSGARPAVGPEDLRRARHDDTAVAPALWRLLDALLRPTADDDAPPSAQHGGASARHGGASARQTPSARRAPATEEDGKDALRGSVALRLLASGYARANRLAPPAEAGARELLLALGFALQAAGVLGAVRRPAAEAAPPPQSWGPILGLHG